MADHSARIKELYNLFEGLDLGEMAYERIPILGILVLKIKQKLNLQKGRL